MLLLLSNNSNKSLKRRSLKKSLKRISLRIKHIYNIYLLYILFIDRSYSYK